VRGQTILYLLTHFGDFLVDISRHRAARRFDLSLQMVCPTKTTSTSVRRLVRRPLEPGPHVSCEHLANADAQSGNIHHHQASIPTAMAAKPSAAPSRAASKADRARVDMVSSSLGDRTNAQRGQGLQDTTTAASIAHPQNVICPALARVGRPNFSNALRRPFGQFLCDALR